MRVIEQKMIAAIKAGTNMRNGNTVVEADSDGKWWRVLLHNNVIATGSAESFRFTLAGGNTKTTRSRVNALLREFTNGYSVYQHKFEPYFNKRAIGTSEWISLSFVDGDWR